MPTMASSVGDHRRQQRAAGPFVFGTEIGSGDPPHGRERRADIFHRLTSPGNGLKGLKNRKNRAFSA